MDSPQRVVPFIAKRRLAGDGFRLPIPDAIAVDKFVQEQRMVYRMSINEIANRVEKEGLLALANEIRVQYLL